MRKRNRNIFSCVIAPIILSLLGMVTTRMLYRPRVQTVGNYVELKHKIACKRSKTLFITVTPVNSFFVFLRLAPRGEKRTSRSALLSGTPGRILNFLGRLCNYRFRRCRDTSYYCPRIGRNNYWRHSFWLYDFDHTNVPTATAHTHHRALCFNISDDACYHFLGKPRGERITLL